MQLPQLPNKFFDSLEITPAPYPVRILREEPWYSFTKHNGYIPFAKRLQMKVNSEMDECERLWNIFTPNHRLFELWEVRKKFFDVFQIEPYFLTLFGGNYEDDNDVMGVLPLWVDNIDYNGKYAWCGGFWPEDNTFFVKDTEAIPLLLMAAPTPIQLDCINPHADYEFLKSLYGYGEDESWKYYLDLTKYKTLEDYLSKLKKKKRYNLKRDRKRILSLRPKIVYNDLSHIDYLFKHNINRFRMKFPDNPDNQSIFEDSKQQELFKVLIKNPHSYKVRVISTVINGEIEAVELGFVYNKTYYAITAGVNVEKYHGLGIFSSLLVMEDALKQNCDKIDFFEGDYNWKDSWSLNSYHHHKFSK